MSQSVAEDEGKDPKDRFLESLDNRTAFSSLQDRIVVEADELQSTSSSSIPLFYYEFSWLLVGLPLSSLS